MSFADGKCPLCGVEMRVPEGQKRCFCTSCGQQVLVSAAIAFASADSTATSPMLQELESIQVEHGAASPSPRPEPVAGMDAPAPGIGVPERRAESQVESRVESQVENQVESQAERSREMSAQEERNPSWGKTIGIFFGCWFIAVTCCAVVSLLVGSSVGLSGYSNGGLLMLVVGIACAAYYRSSGKAAAAIAGALVAGVAIGLLVVCLSVWLV